MKLFSSNKSKQKIPLMVVPDHLSYEDYGNLNVTIVSITGDSLLKGLMFQEEVDRILTIIKKNTEGGTEQIIEFVDGPAKAKTYISTFAIGMVIVQDREVRGT